MSLSRYLIDLCYPVDSNQLQTNANACHFLLVCENSSRDQENTRCKTLFDSGMVLGKVRAKGYFYYKKKIAIQDVLFDNYSYKKIQMVFHVLFLVQQSLSIFQVHLAYQQCGKTAVEWFLIN